jgi:hypothetical protein
MALVMKLSLIPCSIPSKSLGKEKSLGKPGDLSGIKIFSKKVLTIF